MNICVTGSRHWTNRYLLEAVLRLYLQADQRTRLHVGDARGADSIARELADTTGQLGNVYFANWKELGKRAGPERNLRMLEAAQPGLLIAFRLRDSPSGSRGTDHCIKAAKLRGIPTIVVEADTQTCGS